ncbi:Histidine-trna ligase [Thalictrum thalictroides]|uniref:Histidine-trna ligase n=1 Tax=Thalictrum thalictroides TaxID=46969 RepID=A0A7J6WFG7_THATH|nr:Histidine-trna ligase [Thalictrum thalictroides]
MSSGEDKKVSTQQIQAVQNLIEHCLQLYMNQKEVMDHLFARAKIEPDFTELVWQKLEDQNQEFFKAYHVCLMVKHQITMFNNLLVKQVELMRTMRPVGVTSLPISNGSHSSMHRAPFFVTDHTVPLPRPESLHHPIGSSSTFINGAQSIHASMQSVDDTSVHAGSMDASANMHATQNSHTGMNGVAIKSEPRFADSSGYTFGADGNVLEISPTIGGAVIPSFGSVEPNPQPLNGSLLDAETTSSFGFLGQIPRNFSLSDLTAHFSQSSEILESYSRSPFLGTDVSAFLGSPGRECQGENGRLEAISEGLSYEEFCSD